MAPVTSLGHVHWGYFLCQGTLLNFANFYIVSTDLDHSQGGYSIRINIHDSLGVVAPEDEAEECLAFMQQCMRQLPPWAEGLPIDCEAEIGEDFRVA